ncbi:MAG: PDZ domain-containing protein [Desulfobacterales bacterium]
MKFQILRGDRGTVQPRQRRRPVIVVNVAPDSKGAKAGTCQGDVIKEINHQPVKDVDDYKAIVKKGG